MDARRDRGTQDEGGDPPCWCHLFDDEPDAAAPGSGQCEERVADGFR